MESCKKVCTIPRRDEIKITKIFDKSYGSSGHCWEIFAKSKREPDNEFSLPTYWVDHNPDILGKAEVSLGAKKSKEPLQIDTEFLEEVSCSF